MLTLAYRAAAVVVGLLLLVVGVAGLFLPFLPGLILIALGLSVTSLGSERIAACVRAAKDRVGKAWNRRRPTRKDSP